MDNARPDIIPVARDELTFRSADPAASSRDEPCAETWRALGERHADRGETPEAIAAFERAACIAPRAAPVLSALAALYLRHGHLLPALEHAEQGLRVTEGAERTSFFIIGGRALCELGRHEEALAALSNAMRSAPSDPRSYLALGQVFEAQGRLPEAFQAYQQAIALGTQDILAFNNLAGVLVGLGQLELAIAAARLAVALAPANPEVYLNLALALRLRGDEEEALAAYRTVVSLKPDHGIALVELCHARQHACDWEGLSEQQEAAARHSYRKGQLVSPFAIMAASPDPADQLVCAQAWGEHLRHLGDGIAFPAGRRSSGRIKLGYLSADFHHHATAMLIVDMLAHQDRGTFELVGYSMGPDDGSALRARLARTFDRFVDLRGMPDADAADVIRADGIDILLDLKGFTQNARIGILARRPAPIQVNYLGFPGTMGVPFIDYVIADAQVLPETHGRFFQEKVARLPHCYQPNDRARLVPDRARQRTAFGLPEHGFVFCCFNNPYKITPKLFDVWMRLLRQVPDSVLWLLASNKQAAANLRREAERRGVAAGRLIFAAFAPTDEHLTRLAQADLFLDTSPVNAHTTASEALWVGLPLVTCAGETFASRVAGSLLNAVGLPDLVTTSLANYQATALALAQHPERLAALRQRLHDARSTAPLFDTSRYARHFEAALRIMTERREAGLAPESFDVAAT